MIHVVTPAEAEEAEYLVCARLGTATPFGDNCRGECVMCGEAVIFRPCSPVKPPRICFGCALERMEATVQ